MGKFVLLIFIVILFIIVISLTIVDSQRIYDSLEEGDKIRYYDEYYDSETCKEWVPATVIIKDNHKYFYHQFLKENVKITRYLIQSGNIWIEKESFNPPV